MSGFRTGSEPSRQTCLVLDLGRPQDRPFASPRVSKPELSFSRIAYYHRTRGSGMQVAAAAQDSVLERPKRDEVFEGLMRDVYRSAYTLAYRLTGNPVEAEDLVQDTFIRAYRFFNRYDDRLPFSSWLYRIMTNAHIDMVRRRGRLKTTPLEGGGPDGTSSWDLPD